MYRRTRGVVATVGAASLLALAACGGGSSSSDSEYAAVVEPIEGSEMSRITLTQRAAQRLDVKTVAVRSTDGGTSVPYSAVLYGPDGSAWVYTNPQLLHFVRAPIEIASISDGRVVLSKGPAAGTRVVSLGVTELFGAESGLGQ